MFIFIWIFKIAAWLIAQVGFGLLVDNLLFGPPKKKKKKAQSRLAKEQTTS